MGRHRSRGVASAVAVLAVVFSASCSSSSSLHGHAADEDKNLLALVPTVHDAKSVANAPTAALRQAPERPSLEGLVMKARYWTVDRNAQSVYEELTATVPDGLKNTGRGSGGGPSLEDQSQTVTDEPRSLPAGISYAELELEVVPTSATTSAIGAYALAVAQPPRPAASMVPSGASVTVIATGGGRVTRREALSADTAARLVHDFNQLPVSTIGETSCPAGDGSEIGATMRADGHVWQATTGDCGYVFVRVTRDGKQDSVLSGSGPFVADLKRGLGVPPSAVVVRRLAAIVAGLERLNGKAFGAQAVFVTSEAAAVKTLPGDAAVVHNTAPVYVVELQGRFRCTSCDIPPGAKEPKGSVMIDVVDAHTFQGENFTVSNQFVSLGEVGVPFTVPVS